MTVDRSSSAVIRHTNAVKSFLCIPGFHCTLISLYYIIMLVCLCALYMQCRYITTAGSLHNIMHVYRNCIVYTKTMELAQCIKIAEKDADGQRGQCAK
jgi:hypothetical protein